MRYELLPSIFNDFDCIFKPSLSVDYFLDEDENGYHLSLDLPGIKKSELQVEANQGVLTIKAENKTKDKTRSYHRSFRIPSTVKTDEIEAELVDGVLLLKMPKKEEQKAKLIQIK